MALSTARTLDALRGEYQALYDSAVIRPERLRSVDDRVNRLAASEARYRSVADPLGVPWHVVAIVHSLEGGGFGAHLHNGDPLTARTTHVPVGRPVAGNPPFTWEESAIDAIRSRGWSGATDWSVPGTLYQLEKYNGFGYRPLGVPTPYLWSFTSQYSRGKFTSDGQFDPNAVSAQVGAAALLKRMAERGLIAAPSGSTLVWPWVVGFSLAGLGAWLIAAK